MPASDSKRRLTAFVVAMAILIATPLAVVAADAFSDVPDSNVHHDDITWLKDNGVTAGCNPPDNTEFCPGDPVLRQQMASFMRRLAENQIVDAATAQTADNADMLDGQDSTAYSTVVGAASCSPSDDGTTTSCGPSPSGTVPDQTTIEVLEVNLDVPAAGTVVVSAFTRATTTSWVTLDAECKPFSESQAIRAQMLNGLALIGPERGAGTTATPVDSGHHAFRLCTAYDDTGGGGVIVAGGLVAEWTASGSVEIQSAPPGDGSPLDLAALGG